ncbi:alpha-S1-casein isoform X2 [Ursus arctos]|uniref:alpha-S1-casein isoform X2 n=1 Tax=Ursus arctos TaxID=9644 RepID=UPI001CF8B276|nr:alpha-S1-casein isoform X2 [Ursus arctos]
MKVLILTCLVAVALARPKLPPRHPELIQNEPDSREEVLKERQFPGFALQYLSELSRRELLKEKQNDVLKGQAVEDPEQRQSSSSSSSEEVVPSTTEQKQIPREDILNQRYLEQLRRLSKYNQQQQETTHDQQQLPGVNENNLLQLPFQQFYQLDAYPLAAWYYLPQIMQYIAYTPSYDIIKPMASENIENVDVVPEW